MATAQDGRPCYDLADFAPSALVTSEALRRALKNLDRTLLDAESRRPAIDSLLQGLQRNDEVHRLALPLILAGVLWPRFRSTSHLNHITQITTTSLLIGLRHFLYPISPSTSARRLPPF